MPSAQPIEAEHHHAADAEPAGADRQAAQSSAAAAKFQAIRGASSAIVLYSFSYVSLSSPRRARLPISAEMPNAQGGKLLAVPHPVDQGAERRRGDRHDVVDVMGEASARGVAVLDRSEHRAEVEGEAVGILVPWAQGLGREVGGVAADLAHVRGGLEQEAVVTGDPQRHVLAPQVVEAEALIEQPDEGTDRRRGVVVFRLAEQQRRPPLEVAQVDVVAEGRAHDRAGRRDEDDDLRLRVVPLGVGTDADLGRASDRREHGRLGEELGVGADPDLEILAPHPLGHEVLLEACRLGGAGPQLAQLGAEQARGCSDASCSRRRRRRGRVPR